MLCKLCGKRLVRFIILRYHQKPTRIFIDSMHDSRTDNPIDGRKSVRAVKHNCIDKCSGVIADCRMHDHALRLIDNQHILIFIYNVERNVLRLDYKLLRLRNRKFHAVAGLYFILFRSHRLAV